ncbi:hypothetical protein LJC17_04780 [Acholeplasma sp. OttesenSCG-928-E16]|nr:hypothetical protein [Acholeplasma sp. OttesenSCG-928-E16]
MRTFENYISLSIWGEWLGGRISENAYLLTKEEKKEDVITLYFNGNEKCTIIKPVGFSHQGRHLTLSSAEKIIWEFYYYGRPQTEENLVTVCYTLLDDSRVHVIMHSNYWKRDEIIKINGNKAISSI